MSAARKDRRRRPRGQAEPASVALVTARGVPAYWHLLDYSENGLLLEGVPTLQQGEPVLVSFTLGPGRTWTRVGTVVRVEGGPDPHRPVRVAVNLAHSASTSPVPSTALAVRAQPQSPPVPPPPRPERSRSRLGDAALAVVVAGAIGATAMSLSARHLPDSAATESTSIGRRSAAGTSRPYRAARREPARISPKPAPEREDRREDVSQRRPVPPKAAADNYAPAADTARLNASTPLNRHVSAAEAAPPDSSPTPATASDRGATELHTPAPSAPPGPETTAAADADVTAPLAAPEALGPPPVAPSSPQDAEGAPAPAEPAPERRTESRPATSARRTEPAAAKRDSGQDCKSAARLLRERKVLLALQVADACIAKRPTAGSYKIRGAALAMLGRYREAADVFERVLELDPDARDAELLRSIIREYRGH